MLSRLLKSLSSLRLAVFIILALAVLISVGTIIEAKYNDAQAAAKLVYKTPWMFGVMILLAINLTAVMVDRWPWKRRHLSFVLAHIGILILLLGSLITMQFGLDGNLRVGIGQSSRWVSSPVTDFVVWTSFDGDRFTKLVEKEVDFFLDRPQKKPLTVMTDVGELKVTEFHPYMFASRRVRSVDNDRVGSALQFQVQNERVNVTEWLVQERKDKLATHEFGPAQVHLGTDPGRGSGRNEVYLQSQGDKFRYVIYDKSAVQTKKGVAGLGEPIATGWMGLQLKVLQFLPKAELGWDFKETDRAGELTNAAIKLTFQGQEHWLQQNDILKLFTEKAVYIVTYGHRRIDLGFDLAVKDFQVGRYPGTSRAATYASRVEVPLFGEATISMNEPLKYNGLTIYQASFQEAPDGTPIASVFSVNRDPGRWLKYLGSLILSIGVIVLFYDRRKAARTALAPRKWED